MRLLPHRILPVLMYHRLGSEPAGDPDLWLEPETFRRQLDWLRRHDYRTLTLEEAYQRLTTRPSGRKEVLLTIDDGFAEDLEIAAEMLAETRARATVFVPVGMLGRQVDLRHPAGGRSMTSSGRLVDEAGLRRWQDAGFDVGSHSLTHVDLTACEAAVAEEEIQRSKDLLQEILGREVRDFCYPFAHHDERVRAAVREAGYRAGYAGEPPMNDLFAVPRMMVYPRDSPARWRRKISGFYYSISALHQRWRRFVGN